MADWLPRNAIVVAAAVASAWYTVLMCTKCNNIEWLIYIEKRW